MGLDAIVQARMSSTRLPSKVLMVLDGSTILEHIIFRLQKSNVISRIIIATSNHESDDPIEELGKNLNITVFRGELNDVLKRYYDCATKYNCKDIIRITGDCPLIDPNLIDLAYKNYVKFGYDLYGLGGEFPDGFDFTIFKYSLLKQANINAFLPSEREHVCVYMEKHSVNQGAFKPFLNCQHLRFTVDQKEDIEFLNKLYEKDSDLFLLNSHEIINLYNSLEQDAITNDHITRNEGYLKSLKNDKV